MTPHRVRLWSLVAVSATILGVALLGYDWVRAPRESV